LPGSDGRITSRTARFGSRRRIDGLGDRLEGVSGSVAFHIGGR
jgi:hypothetical protein